MNDDIQPNICPYCGGSYTIDTRGCANRCRLSQFAATAVRLAADADVTEADELVDATLRVR